MSILGISRHLFVIINLSYLKDVSEVLCRYSLMIRCRLNYQGLKTCVQFSSVNLTVSVFFLF